MPMFDRATPHRYVRWSMRVLCVSAPLALLLLVSWALELWPPMHERPHLVIMLYLLLLSISLGAGVVAALGSCHLAISKAFSAGVHVGQHRPAQPQRTSLRSVE